MTQSYNVVRTQNIEELTRPLNEDGSTFKSIEKYVRGTILFMVYQNSAMCISYFRVMYQ